MKKIIIIFLVAVLFSSCEKMFLGENNEASKMETFEYLWNDIDQGYGLFAVKTVDWDNEYVYYKDLINEEMTNEAFFDLMFEMMNKLNDGHVNLVSPFNISRYEIENPDSLVNYDEDLIRRRYYLRNDYYITSPFKHDYIRSCRPQYSQLQIGYVRYSSFSSTVGSYSMAYVLNRYKYSDGLIFDIRQNGGGAMTNVYAIASCFTSLKYLAFYSEIKNGPGENDFEDPKAVYVDTNEYVDTYKRPIILLIDRGSYSASSFLSLVCKANPNVILVGQNTGGGLGMPGGGQLPNGWQYRFSVSRSAPVSDPSNYSWENGVPPDFYATIDGRGSNMDGIIERAIEIIDSIK